MPAGNLDSQPRGLSLVARRVAGWTSNLLLLSLVLVVGLTFGRQLTSWWALGPDQASRAASGGRAVLAPDPWGGERALHHLTFGDLPLQLGRQTVRGGKAAVFTALRGQCRVGAERGLASTRRPGPDEQKMLSGTAGMTPLDEEPGKWKMYQLDGPIPLVVVTGLGDETPTGEAGQAPARVLCWGLAFPVAGPVEQWTLFTCVPTGGLTAPAADRPVLPQPPGARERMSLWNAAGGGVLLLAGTGDEKEWQRFFDAWFQQQEWSAAEGWQTAGATRHRRYAHSTTGLVVDVVMEVQAELRVMLTVTRSDDL